jgi:UDP-GlcNAc:undecaprenyl-phosphate GlcNAc-1-phosphate transferase
MSPVTLGLLGAVLSGTVAFGLTPLAIRLASRWEFYDHPLGYKAHAAATPYLGGGAVTLAALVVILALGGRWEQTWPVAGGIVTLWVLGTIDDRRTLSPGFRVAVEIALALMLAAAGSGWRLEGAPLLGALLTVVWVVSVVNAVNLFDNMDGAAASIALAISAAVTAMGIARSDAWLAVSGAAVAGACVGFLPYNLCSPARIFLGDGGSMPVGFAVAAMVMIGARTYVPSWNGIALGVLCVGIPALDTCLVIASRRRRGISVLTGGRDHLTHRALRSLGTTRAVALVLGGSQALLAAVALLASGSGRGTLAVALVLYLVGAVTAIVVMDRDRPVPAD